MATFTPPASMALTGAIPFLSRRFELGLWQTVVPESASNSMSPSVSHTEWAQESSGPRKPRSAR